MTFLGRYKVQNYILKLDEKRGYLGSKDGLKQMDPFRVKFKTTKNKKISMTIKLTSIKV